MAEANGCSGDRSVVVAQSQGPIAQLVERAPDKGEVDSSTLSRPTTNPVARTTVRRRFDLSKV